MLYNNHDVFINIPSTNLLSYKDNLFLKLISPLSTIVYIGHCWQNLFIEYRVDLYTRGALIVRSFQISYLTGVSTIDDINIYIPIAVVSLT